MHTNNPYKTTLPQIHSNTNKLTKSYDDFTNRIYKTYNKQIVPTLYYHPIEYNYPSPLSNGTYLVNEYNERNELLLDIREQNVKLKYMIFHLKQEAEEEKIKTMEAMKEMKQNFVQTDDKLKYNTTLLEDIKKQLKDMGRVRRFKKQYHWQRTIPAFINMYRLYKYSLELALNRPLRDGLIRKRRLTFEEEILLIRKWSFGIQSELFASLAKYKESKKKLKFLNGNTEEYYKNPFIFEKDEIIQHFLKLFLKSLITNATEINEITHQVLEVLYSYVRDGIYYKKDFLSTFEVNRLKFNFFGETEDNTKSGRGMILSFFIISKVFIHAGIFKTEYKDNVFNEGDLNPQVIDFLKIFGSILHYITRETFTLK